MPDLTEQSWPHYFKKKDQQIDILTSRLDKNFRPLRANLMPQK